MDTDRIQYIEGNIDNIVFKLKSLAQKLFTRNRITLSVSGDKADSELTDMVNLLPCSGARISNEAHYKPLGIRQEGIIIPAAVSFAVKGSNIYLHNASYNGSYQLCLWYVILR